MFQSRDQLGGKYVVPGRQRHLRQQVNIDRCPAIGVDRVFVGPDCFIADAAADLQKIALAGIFNIADGIDHAAAGNDMLNILGMIIISIIRIWRIKNNVVGKQFFAAKPIEVESIVSIPAGKYSVARPGFSDPPDPSNRITRRCLSGIGASF